MNAPVAHKNLKETIGHNVESHDGTIAEYILPDLTEVNRFLDLLGTDEEFTFQTFADNDSGSSNLARVFHGTLGQHADALTELNKQGAGVFVMINRGDGVIHDGSKTCRTKSNVTGIRSVFIDLDENATEKIDRVIKSDLPPSIVVESSIGKFHCYWLVDNCSLEQFTNIQESLASKYQSDPTVKDLARVMRLPGFYHQKNKAVMTKINEQLSSKKSGLNIFDVIDRNGIEVSATKKKPQLSAVSNTIAEGSRNMTLTKVAGAMKARNMSVEEIGEQLKNINQKRCMPPLEIDEVLRIASSIGRYVPNDSNRSLEESLTDTGNAERFNNRYSSTVKYVHDWGKFIIFNGHYWQVDNVNKVMEFAKQIARDIYHEGAIVDDMKLRNELSKHSLKSQQLSRLKAMVDLTKSIPSMIVSSTALNNDDMLLCVKNGVVDLRDGSFREGRSEDYITQVAPVDFNSESKCPRFLRFLDETFVGSASSTMSEQISMSERRELIDYMQKSLGYCLTGETGEQCLFFAHGTGANGKTTLINLMLTMLGNDYSLQTPMDTLMVKSAGNSSSNHLARLQNIRFVASTEVEEGARVSESLIKQMTGGDRIAARFLYKEFVEFTPRFKLFIAGNHKPIIKGDDLGIWRRIHLVPFEITVPAEKRDSTLPEQLRSELSGILNWLIQGCIKWKQTGFKQPKLVEQAVSEYKEEMDTLGIWIDECCKVGAGLMARGNEAYNSYQHWTIANGFQSVCSPNFYRKLSERFSKHRDSRGNYYRGFKLQMM